MATISLQAAYDQARRFLEVNDTERAIGFIQHILEYFPNDIETYRLLGEAYLASRQFDQAEAAFQRVLHADPESIPAHFGLGLTYERQGQLDRAVNEFEQALEIKPDMTELRSQLLRLYTEAWGSDYAQLRLSRSGLARLYAKGHMLSQSIQEFRSVISENPERYDARVGLVEVLWRDGQEDVAIEMCEDILSQRPDVLKANLLLGFIHLASGDSHGERYWQAAQQLDPYQTVATVLFDTLPDLNAPETNLPEWDEAAWYAQMMRQKQEVEEQQRRKHDLPSGNNVVDAATATAGSAGATTGAAGAALGGIAAAGILAYSGQEEQTEAQSDTDSSIDVTDDDFLASLLSGGESNAPQITPFSTADLENLPDVKPFDVDTFDPSGTMANEPDSAPTADTPHEAGNEPDLTPFSFDDLGLSPEEVAAMGLGEEATAADTETRTAADMVSEEDEPDLTPFSFDDLGLSPEEIDVINQTEQTAALPPEDSMSDDQPAGLTPFSLDDLGFGGEDFSDFDPENMQQSGHQQQLPGGAGSRAAAEAFASDIDDHDERVSSSPEQSHTDFSDDEAGFADLTPFSLDDLNFPEDVASGALPSSLQPFSLDESAAMSMMPSMPMPNQDLHPSPSMKGLARMMKKVVLNQPHIVGNFQRRNQKRIL
ncbi:MAG: tetratricopeptide repeat protein [Chloroflexaceae bacterium]|nr:tetratricopeptide repeat protein [Chloroflexaceae bacterium]